MLAIRPRLVLILFAILSYAPALAQVVVDDFLPEYSDPQLCKTSLSGEKLIVAFDADEERLYDNYSLREMFFGGSSNISCPAYVSLRLLTPDLNDDQRGVFCISYDETRDTISGFSEGERDAYLICKEPSVPICDRVNDSKEAALAIVGLGAGATAGASTATAAAGLSVVPHSSGAVILTGSSGYIAGTLGTVATSALSILTAPATVAGATITLVAVGGAVYVCSE